MNDKAKAILAACGQAIMRWPANGETTFCNCAVNFIACAAGFTGFRGLVANEIAGILFKSADFAKVSPEDAQKLANDGRLVIAAIKDEPHGHVAAVCPGSEIVYSSKWRKNCPTVANVGKNNGVFGSNWAFAKEPGYFAWIETEQVPKLA